MDIYILRDGKETGPFSEETTKTLLQQGSISEADFAWHSGLPKWIPLASVLNPVPPALETPPPPPPAAVETPLPTFATTSLPVPSGEPATDKQKALLGYLGIPFSSELSKDQAALLVNEAMEDPKKAGRLAQWNTDRLKLHPDLFAAEIKEKKEARPSDYLEICQTEGAEYFTKITKAHCQVLVGFLDVKFPDWDDDPQEAPRKYFFPAVAEKFPQLVAKAWQGKLRYATGPKLADEPARQRPATGTLRKKKPLPQLPLAAIGRGLVFAVLLLGMFFFVRKLLAPGDSKPSPLAEKTAGIPATTPAPEPLAPAPEPLNVEALPAIEPEKKPAAPNDPLAPPPDPAAPAAPADPADPKMALDPKMAADPAAPKPADPLPGLPPDPLAPPPAPPAGDPAAPAIPPAATTPAVPPAAPVDPGAVVKSTLKLTKAVEVQLAYGKMKLPVGTPVKFISREGHLVKVSYLNTVLTLPVASTDIGVPENVPAPAPALPPAPVPAPPADL